MNKSLLLALIVFVAAATVQSVVVVQDLNANRFTVTGAWQSFTAAPMTFDHTQMQVGMELNLNWNGNMSLDASTVRRLHVEMSGTTVADTGDISDVLGETSPMTYQAQVRFVVVSADTVNSLITYQLISGTFIYTSDYSTLTKVFLFKPASTTVNYASSSDIQIKLRMDPVTDMPIDFVNYGFVAAVGYFPVNDTSVNAVFTSSACASNTAVISIGLTKEASRNEVTAILPPVSCTTGLSLGLTPYTLTSTTSVIPSSFRPPYNLNIPIVYSVGTTESAGGYVTIGSNGFIYIKFSTTVSLASAIGTLTSSILAWKTS